MQEDRIQIKGTKDGVNAKIHKDSRIENVHGSFSVNDIQAFNMLSYAFFKLLVV